MKPIKLEKKVKVQIGELKKIKKRLQDLEQKFVKFESELKVRI